MHVRVRALAAKPEVRARVTRRLIALTDAGRHDLARTGARLDALLAELDVIDTRPGAAQEGSRALPSRERPAEEDL